MDAILRKKGASQMERVINRKLFRLLIKTEKLEGIICELEPGASSEFYHHKGEEVRIMIKGSIEYQVGEKTYTLKEGDVLWHRSDVPHRGTNTGKGKAVYFTVGVPPTFM
jgi:quercetin dioxygenase-like cupin family protein